MIISKFFKPKKADGSFGDPIYFSTSSDLVFYSDNKTLTAKTKL